MKLFCSACAEECRPKVYDQSFSHAFGIEHVYVILSNCCGSIILSEDGELIQESELEEIINEGNY